MLKNFKLTIEYDGTAYHGWQRQKNGFTVQGTIENAIKKMTKIRVNLSGSGRTDAGVHALGQTANFKLETGLDEEIFFRGLNSLLPEDIIIKKCEQVIEEFHARFDAVNKVYEYRILNRKTPKAIGRQYVWLIKKKLNINVMNEAAEHLIGKHDFKAFEGTGSPRAHTERTIMEAGFTEYSRDIIIFKIQADGFLRYMVRNIIATLVAVGLNKITKEEFKTILESKDRINASPTAPPHGLFLVEVNYPPHKNLVY